MFTTSQIAKKELPNMHALNNPSIHVSRQQGL